MKKHFNKNLVMSEEEEHLFQQSKTCWICRKLIDSDEIKLKIIVKEKLEIIVT